MTNIKKAATLSMLAVMTAFPACAVDDNNTNGDSEMVSDIKSGYHKTGKAITETGQDIKAFFMGKDENQSIRPVVIRRSQTADGLIGQSVMNDRNEKIATVRDIIIDKNGKASMIVVADSGMLGIGKKVAAFDYSRVVTQKSDGKVMMRLTQDNIDRAADFSYDQDDWQKAKVIPVGSMSVNKLLKGDILDNNNNKVASIENIYIRNNDVSRVIVQFNDDFGFGGDLAALDYDSLQAVRSYDDLDFKLTATQAAQFRNFKASIK